MRKELIELLSKYVELDKEALELNFEQEGEQMALMLSIPVLRAKDEAEIEAALKEADEKAAQEESDEGSEEGEDSEAAEGESEEDSEDASVEETSESSENSEEQKQQDTQNSQEEEVSFEPNPEDYSEPKKTKSKKKTEEQ